MVEFIPEVPATTTNQQFTDQEIHLSQPSSNDEADNLKASLGTRAPEATSKSSSPAATLEDSAHDEPALNDDDSLFESANSSSSTDSSQTSPDVNKTMLQHMIPELFEDDLNSENLISEPPSNSTLNERRSTRSTHPPQRTHDYHMLLAVSNIDNPIVNDPLPQTVSQAFHSPDKKL